MFLARYNSLIERASEESLHISNKIIAANQGTNFPVFNMILVQSFHNPQIWERSGRCPKRGIPTTSVSLSNIWSFPKSSGLPPTTHPNLNRSVQYKSSIYSTTIFYIFDRNGWYQYRSSNGWELRLPPWLAKFSINLSWSVQYKSHPFMQDPEIPICWRNVGVPQLRVPLSCRVRDIGGLGRRRRSGIF